MITDNLQNWLSYEYYSMKIHRENYSNQTTWHWTQIPEQVLNESGFI